MIFIEDTCQVYVDERGQLTQFVTEEYLTKHNLPLGQVYLLTFNAAGVVRGNHYHKESSEVFCLIQGEVEMIFEDVTTKERTYLHVNALTGVARRILIGPHVAHTIVSKSGSAVLASYSSVVYNNVNPDVYSYQLV